MRRASWLIAALVLSACASDPAVMRWVDSWKAGERKVDKGDFEGGAASLEALAERALLPADRTMARMGQARALEKQGKLAEAFAIYAAEGDEAVRRIDRARARHEQARIAEDVGGARVATPLYRRIVLTYPDLMPGLRALQRLQVLAERGSADLNEHLAWSRRAYDVLEHTTLGDNLVYYAGHTAYRAWRLTGDPAMAEAAEELFTILDSDHFLDGLWEEGVWELSWLYHHKEDYDAEVRAMRRILRTREASWVMGSYDSPYYWYALLRIARLQALKLGQPEDAIRSWQRLLDRFPVSTWRDDALFWQGCAWLRAGRSDRAEVAFAAIPEAYEHSKYLRRLDRARAEPDGPICDPKEIEEGLP